MACYIRKTKLHAFGTLRSCSAADFPQSQCFFNILPDVLLNFAKFSKLNELFIIKFIISFASLKRTIMLAHALVKVVELALDRER